MSNAKRVLGRGLEDLIPRGGNADSPAPNGKAPLVAPNREIPVASLHPNPKQPRTRFDENALSELADSVRANGILQPILVRPRPAGGYEIVAGERRYRAALKAGLKQVPVVVRELSDEETLALALIENLIREDIGPMETARAFRRLMDDFGWTQEEMAQRVGKSRPAVANALRLLNLPEQIQGSLERGEITEGHARALLLGRDNPLGGEARRTHQMKTWRAILEKELTVRDVERIMSPVYGDAAKPAPTAVRTPATSPASANPNLEAVAERLRRVFGTKVQIVGSEETGRIQIEYFSGEELDGLLSRIEGKAS